MKILLTGGSGMVGRNLRDYAQIKRQDEIIAPSSKELNLLDYDNVLEYVKQTKPDVIIHAAGVVGGIQANINNPVKFLVDNMTMGMNIINAAKRPHWALQTLIHGQPSFEILKPYMSKNLNLNQLAKFMDATFSGRLDEEKIKKIRDLWKGKLVLKGAESAHDVEKAYQLGLDGVIISNHGGRQVDVGQATVDSLKDIAPKFMTVSLYIPSRIRTFQTSS